MTKEIMTVRDLAKYLNLHMVTIYRLLRKNSIPGTRVGGSWRFYKKNIDKFISNKTIGRHR